MSRENKKPGRFLGPLVITGITAGVLYSAYKAIFKQPEYQTTFTDNENSNVESSSEHTHASEQPKDIVASVDHTPSTENASREEGKSSSETATTNSNDATNN
ncbi:hypothetical protein P256_01138 [Acinetobacter nectaris CIP 110549]|uniref:Uncharacterized protein n=1 Tax=Acinetobacter nectaris CIP 110549 TaxID=1392540 RepID=V2TDA5_9GAMM|nr:hypothetical protein P256_01138 [Acinetobacter nectaris CIP 110549]